jgi:5'-nucleotidase
MCFTGVKSAIIQNMNTETQKKRILLTGDDGYNSVGTRLLIRALKDTYDLQIAATLHQQSGVGGKLSLKSGGTWGEDTVDGVPALWVDGTPCDVMECAQGYFDKPFDLLISGINLGPNASTAVISSGTYSAAVRGLGATVAPRAVAISWDLPSEFWLQMHDGQTDITPFFDYPGDILKPLFDTILENELWGVQLLNINLPHTPTKEIRFTKILKDITQYFRYPIHMDHEKHQYSYQGEPFDVKEKNLRYDVAAIEQGFISISPCAFEMTHFTTFERLQSKPILLD